MKRDLAWYLERLADPSWLCRLEPDEGRTVMDSSLNPRHGPRDCNCFLRQEEEGWNVLVDYEGAGCLTRFWTAGASTAATCRRFVRHCANFSPVGWRLSPSHWCSIVRIRARDVSAICRFPSPRAARFARSDTRLFYWQINALLYEDADVDLRPRPERSGAEWHGTAAGPLGSGQRIWLGAADDGRPRDARRRGPGELCDLPGAGCIEQLTFRATDPAMLSRLALRASWDGDAGGGVQAFQQPSTYGLRENSLCRAGPACCSHWRGISCVYR